MHVQIAQQTAVPRPAPQAQAAPKTGLLCHTYGVSTPHMVSLHHSGLQQNQYVPSLQKNLGCNVSRGTTDEASLLQAHVVHVCVCLIHNLLLQQLLNDILNGDDAHRRCCVVFTKARQA